MLHDHNTFVQRFKQVMDMPVNNLPQWEVVIRVNGNVDPDATMLLLPSKWLGCCQVRFFSNVYYCVVCLLPSYISCNVPHSLT